MIINEERISREAFQAGTGWEIKPEGACKGAVCIPLDMDVGESVDVAAIADAMSLPLVRNEDHGLWALGPESIGGKALVTAKAPNLTLPMLDGNTFELSSLIGQKVIIYAWAPY